MPDHQAYLNRLRHWRVVAPKGRVIYEEGEESIAFYRVETGCVRLQVNADLGHRQILAFCLPGDVFGLQMDGPRDTSAEAAAVTTLSRFPLSALAADTWEAGPPNGAAIAGLISAATRLSTTLADHLKGLGHGSTEDRLLWFLEWLAERQGVSPFGGVLQPPMSRRDIADFLCMAQETLSRTFARLVERGLIRVRSDRRIQLRPRPRPREEAGEGLQRAA